MFCKINSRPPVAMTRTRHFEYESYSYMFSFKTTNISTYTPPLGFLEF